MQVLITAPSLPPERSISVTGRIASAFVVSAALGETLLPMLVALTYAGSHARFLQIILITCVAQVGAFALARRAVGHIDRRRTGGVSGVASSTIEILSEVSMVDGEVKPANEG